MLQVIEVPNQNNLLHHVHIFSADISCKIFPNLGASMQEYIFKDVDIIDGISIDEDGINDYFNTHKSALLFPFPNRVKDGNYMFADKNYQLDLNEPELQNAIHGLIFDKHFKIIDKQVTSQEAKVLFSYVSDGSLTGYPFKFIFNIEYLINSEGKITTTMEIKNIDEKTFPFGIGWHPYFRSQNLANSSLSFKANEHFIFSERSIPEEVKKSDFPNSFVIPDKMLDDGFSLHKAYVKYVDSKFELNVEFENKITPYLQIYTPSHRKNIAIEPMTCATDAFNNKYGLLELDAKETFKWVITLDVTLIE